MAVLGLGTIANDVSAYLGSSENSYVAADHQTSILLVFFSAFLAGNAACFRESTNSESEQQ
jgi:hypothetical protein